MVVALSFAQSVASSTSSLLEDKQLCRLLFQLACYLQKRSRVGWLATCFVAFDSEKRSPCRFLSRDDAALSPALLVALLVASSLFLKG
jgi:hypothetical protein